MYIYVQEEANKQSERASKQAGRERLHFIVKICCLFE